MVTLQGYESGGKFHFCNEGGNVLEVVELATVTDRLFHDTVTVEITNLKKNKKEIIIFPMTKLANVLGLKKENNVPTENFKQILTKKLSNTIKEKNEIRNEMFKEQYERRKEQINKFLSSEKTHQYFDPDSTKSDISNLNKKLQTTVEECEKNVGTTFQYDVERGLKFLIRSNEKHVDFPIDFQEDIDTRIQQRLDAMPIEKREKMEEIVIADTYLTASLEGLNTILVSENDKKWMPVLQTLLSQSFFNDPSRGVTAINADFLEDTFEDNNGKSYKLNFSKSSERLPKIACNIERNEEGEITRISFETNIVFSTSVAPDLSGIKEKGLPSFPFATLNIKAEVVRDDKGNFIVDPKTYNLKVKSDLIEESA